MVLMPPRVRICLNTSDVGFLILNSKTMSPELNFQNKKNRQRLYLEIND